MTNDSIRRRSVLAALGSGAVGSLAGCAATVGDARSSIAGDDDTLVVAPDGSDWNPGTDDSPLGTIETALERAEAGDTVELRPGEYSEAVSTVRDGEPDAPITITGPPEAVIRPPPGTNECLMIEHSHTHVRGTTIDGLLEPDRKFEDYEAWAPRCVFVTPVGRRDEGVEYVRDVVVEPARIGNSARAMIQTIRMRNVSIGNFEVIGPAGMQFDPRVDDHEVGHVREIVYVGNAEPARGEPYYEYETLDRTRNVRIHHIDNSAGYAHNELVDVKLGSTNVTVEYCTDRNAGHNTEFRVSPAVQLNGNDCTVRWNDIGECPLPFSFAPWTPSPDVDAEDWANDNAIYGNHIHDFAAGPFQLRDARDVGPVSFDDQRVICGNRIERGSLALDPWVGEANGFDGGVADERGSDEVSVAVGAGSDGHAFDPPVVRVDRGATIAWEWTGDGGGHYVVRAGRVESDPDDVPEPRTGENTQTRSFEDVGLYRYACYQHHDQGMRGALLVANDEDRYAFATADCDGEVPAGDGVGHTAGESA